MSTPQMPSAASTSIGPYDFGNDVSGFDVNALALSRGNNVADWSGAYRPGFTGYNGSNGAPNPSAGFYGDGATIQASNSARSQENAMAIQANDAANWAAAQQAAAFQRESIGAGAPAVFVNPQIFNPGTPGAGFQNPISVLPTIAAPTGPAIASFIPQQAAFAPNMSGFGQWR